MTSRSAGRTTRRRTVARGPCEVDYPPTRSYVWSCVWFLQELLIFAIGARVFWKRPNDDSARLFFLLCIVTVGAYMGGYHWTEIVVEPGADLSRSRFFAVFVPVVNLHFYLVFPRRNPVLVRHRRWVLGALYGIPTAIWPALWGSMYAGALAAAPRRRPPTTPAPSGSCAGLALGYIGLAVVDLRALHRAAWSTATARPGRAPRRTRSSGSCWPR